MLRRTRTTMLPLMFSVLVGVMAVNVSAAQAKWQLLKDLTAVNLLALNASLLGGEFLVPTVDLKINCTGGTATAHLETLGSGATLDGKAHGTFIGCTVLTFPTCTVHSTGQPNGSVLLKGSGGTATMSGETTTVLQLIDTFVDILGVTCPITELSALLHGSVLLSFLESGKDLKERLAHLDDDVLTYGEEPAAIDGVGGANAVVAHVTEELGKFWSIDLVP